MSRGHPRASFVAEKANSKLTAGAAPVNPRTGERYRVLKVWGAQPKSVAAADLTSYPPTAPADPLMGGIIHVEVDDEGGACDKRIYRIGTRPIYLNLGNWPAARVKTLKVAAENAPIYSMWMDEIPADVAQVRPFYPTASVSSGTTYLVPDGAVRVHADSPITITWGESATTGASVDLARSVAAGEWVDVIGDTFTVSGAAKLFFELDAL